MNTWYWRKRMWRVILYIIVPHMHKDSLSYKGREVPAIKLLYSFASDRNMLIAFLGWVILDLVGRIKILIHFTDFKNTSIHRLLYGANKAFCRGLSYWVDYIQNVASQYSLVVEWSFHQIGQQMMLWVTECPEPLALMGVGWEDGPVLCLEMMRPLLNTT